MKITRKEFKRRLEAMDPEAPCGAQLKCPLEIVFNLSAAEHEYLETRTGAVLEVPKWAGDFMRALDWGKPYPLDWSDVTARQALEVLG